MNDKEKTVSEFSNLTEANPKFYIGDKVRIRTNLKAGEIYGTVYFTSEMCRKSGMKAKINGVCAKERKYFLQGFDGIVWSEDMLEPAINATRDELKIIDGADRMAAEYPDEDEILESKVDIIRILNKLGLDRDDQITFITAINTLLNDAKILLGKSYATKKSRMYN